MSAALNPIFSFDVASADIQAPWELTGALAMRAALPHAAVLHAVWHQRPDRDQRSWCWCLGLVDEARGDPASRHGSTADCKVQRRLAAKAANTPGKAHRELAAPAQRVTLGVNAHDPQDTSDDDAASEGGHVLAAADRQTAM
jgi:hypothetical protein